MPGSWWAQNRGPNMHIDWAIPRGVGPPKGLIALTNACVLVLFDKVLDKVAWQIYTN